MHPLIRRWLERAVDRVYALTPRLAPGDAALETSRLIAHRGAHDGNVHVRENTAAAFDACAVGGVDGIELDVQWTRDGRPVVMHDVDGARVFGDGSLRLPGASYREIRRALPEVMRLEEVVERYRGRLHLMVEIKPQTFVPARHAGALADALAPLEPAVDYHLLSLVPELFLPITALPRGAMLPVAETNTRPMYEFALANGLGGLIGHYVLLDRRKRRALAARGMRWGTGYVDSRFALWREVAAGSTWVFSNQPLAVAAHRAARLARRATGRR